MIDPMYVAALVVGGCFVGYVVKTERIERYYRARIDTLERQLTEALQSDANIILDTATYEPASYAERHPVERI